MVVKFSTKARTLQTLNKTVKSAKVARIHIVNVDQWHKNKAACLEDLKSKLQNKRLIVRSSCSQEDNQESSNAGAFLSVPNVTIQNIEEAVENVISSYGSRQENEEVLIQPMLTDVILSGVAFSHDPNTCAPYRVINWSEKGDTTRVTQGMGGKVWFQAAQSRFSPPDKLVKVVKLLEEIIELVGQVPVDCEFAITKNIETEVENEQLWLLQARPLILPHKPEPITKQTEKLSLIQNKVERGMKPNPFLMGKKNVYGVMPDWNPAEIIGIRPKPLALSLYRELVTDSIWAYQRHNYGYRNLRSFPLMPHFSGLPYVDVRVSFNSFVPADLHDDLASQLVDYYVDRLVEEPALHDKIEFEIVFSCYTLDLQQRLKRLDAVGFQKMIAIYLSIAYDALQTV